MRKLAVFVEGYTELIFVEALLLSIAGAHNIRIDLRQIRGGAKSKRTMAVIQAAHKLSGQQYYALLFDCGGDHQVKTRIQEEHENLTRAQYTKIIGLRDVRPTFSHAQIPRLEVELRKYIKTSLIPVEFVLSVMEIEAWFLAEVSHFEKIDPAITRDAILLNLGFDPTVEDMTLRSAPAEDLNACYRIAGKSYSKDNVSTTISALDFSSIHSALSNAA